MRLSLLKLKNLLPRLVAFFLAIFCLVTFNVGQTYAEISWSELYSVASGRGWYDPTDDDCDTEGSTTSTLSGSDNVAKIFNYFVGKGLADYQSAGILGNIHHESGFEPMRAQGIFDRLVSGKDWEQAVGGGWGLVQWTPGSKMVDPTIAAGKNPDDLIVQLDFIWDQLEGRGPIPEKAAGDEVKAAGDVAAATIAFETKYERHAGAPQPGRIAKAEEILAQARSGGISGSPSTSPSTESLASGSKVYMLGDSITRGASSQYKSAFDAKQITLTLSAADSRSWVSAGATTEGTAGTGKEVVAADEAIAESNAIVVALGTNGGLGSNPIEEIISDIKAKNESLKIYWVNIATSATNSKEFNDKLAELSSTLGFTVIDWKNIVDPTGDGSADPNDLLRDNAHPNELGYPKLVELVVNAVANGGGGSAATNTTQSGECCSSDTGKTIGNKAPTQLTDIRDKIAQMLFVRVNSDTEANEVVGTHHVGGIYVSNEFLDGAKIKAAKGMFSPEPFVGIDEEGGQVHRLSSIGPMPSAAEMGAKSNEEVKAIGLDWGKKMADIGVSMDFAPVLDVNDPANPIIGSLGRAFSDDPNVIVEKATAFADGLREAGVTPVFKHFPGHGRSTGDTHVTSASTPTLDELKQLDLKPYESMLSNPDSAVMMAHLHVPGLTTGVEEPASISKPALDLLRNDYGYQGLAMTDDIGDMNAIKSILDLPQAVEKAILAGEDIALFNGANRVKDIIDYIEQQASANPDLASRIDSSSSKIIQQKASKSTPQGGVTCVCTVGGSSKVTSNKSGEGSESTSTGSGPVIVLDPGHAGSTIDREDPETGLHDGDYDNGLETRHAFAVAQLAKAKLEGLGYQVILTKETAEDAKFLRERADVANNANAALAISIHTQGDREFGTWQEIYVQKVGLYRGPPENKHEFTDEAVAAKSQEYAQKMKEARDSIEVKSGETVIKDNSFDGRTGIEPGNIPFVQLYSKVPWIYLEAGGRSNVNTDADLTDEQKGIYADAIVKGVESAVPSSGTGSCPSSNGAVAGDMVQTALNLAWPEKAGHENKVNKEDAKPEYQEAFQTYYLDVGGTTHTTPYSDCGVFVGTVVRASGADPDFPIRGTDIMMKYVEDNPEKYEIVTENVTDTSQLQPGDILVSAKGAPYNRRYGHIAIYVGQQPGGEVAEGSLGGHVPYVQNLWHLNENYRVARLK